jgi:hypothetical protein
MIQQKKILRSAGGELRIAKFLYFMAKLDDGICQTNLEPA